MAKKPSRAQERKRLLEAAARVAVPNEVDVAVVGGGAAGLVAAICAAEAGASVLVLERDLTCGRSILATGNGRCNFANTNLKAERYNEPAFVEAVCGQSWLDDLLSFFSVCGLAWCEENGRLYPASHVSASVRNVLLARAQRAGAILAPAREVTCISPDNQGNFEACVNYRMVADDTEKNQVAHARAVVLACGGGVPSRIEGVHLASAPYEPVLCPLACEESPLAALDGRRARVRASLTKRGSTSACWQEDGEVLFRSYGLSGIVTFDASRRAEPGDLIELDLAPRVSEAGLNALLNEQANEDIEPGRLDGIIDPEIARLLEQLARKRWQIDWPGRTTPPTETQALIQLVKALPFLVHGPTETDRAQVTRGGLLTSQFSSNTLAAKDCSWLFACGEALNIDADCGGFNLAWAWKSGMVAGSAAARRMEGQQHD